MSSLQANVEIELQKAIEILLLGWGVLWKSEVDKQLETKWVANNRTTWNRITNINKEKTTKSRTIRSLIGATKSRIIRSKTTTTKGKRIKIKITWSTRRKERQLIYQMQNLTILNKVYKEKFSKFLYYHE
jgi:DNA integrity scanning protein DisA with diadenylate cyclase activity